MYGLINATRRYEQALFLHYYWCYTSAAKFEIHSILSAAGNFPLELTEMVLAELARANVEDKRSVANVGRRLYSVHNELCMLRKRITGLAPYDPPTLRHRAVYDAVEPATWLEIFAFYELPYIFDLGGELTSRMMEHPHLRELLAEVGVRAVRRSEARGLFVKSEFTETVVMYYRAFTSELFRRYSRDMIKELMLDCMYDVYINCNY